MKRKSDSDLESPKKRGFRRGFGRVLFYTFSFLIIFLLTLVLLTLLMTRKTNEPPAMFGFRLFIVTTDSMRDTIPVGSAIIVQSENTLESGDIITFKETYDDDNNLIINTHRIVRSTPTKSGISFVTKGDSNLVEDAKNRYPDDIFGKVVVIMPGVGNFLIFLKSPIGLITCIALPLLMLLIFEIFNLLRISKEPQDEVTPRKSKETRADLFGTHSNTHAQNLLPIKRKLASDTSEVSKLDLPILANEDSNQQPKRVIDTTLYDTQEFIDKQALPPNSNPTEQDASEFSTKIEVKEEPKIREERIVTKKEEDDEMQSNLEGFALLRSKNNESDINQSEMQVIDHFSNGNNDLAVMAAKTNPEFSALVQAHGKDQFSIDGIDVSVQSDSIKLGFDKSSNGQEISITITKGYTNVVVDGKDFEVNFALFKDEHDDEQKVMIHKKNK